MTSKKSSNKAAFSKHTQQQQQTTTTANNNNDAANTTENNNNNASRRGGDFGQMSLTGRLLVFLLVPCLTGLVGLASSYLQSTRSSPSNKDDDEEAHTIDFDRDFVTPFLLGLAFVIVIGFQTGGFKIGSGSGSGSGGSSLERKFALSWPKAKRIRKVRRERVIVEDDDLNDLNNDDLGEKKER